MSVNLALKRNDIEMGAKFTNVFKNFHIYVIVGI